MTRQENNQSVPRKQRMPKGRAELPLEFSTQDCRLPSSHVLTDCQSTMTLCHALCRRSRTSVLDMMAGQWAALEGWYPLRRARRAAGWPGRFRPHGPSTLSSTGGSW